MYYVYILKSLSYQDKIYIGYTLKISDRLAVHNEGGSVYTKAYKPWELVFFCAFVEKGRALAFEKYLKSHAGRVFIEKRLIN